MRLKNRLLPVLAIATTLVMGTAGLASAHTIGPTWEGPYANLTECLQYQALIGAHGEVVDQCDFYMYGPLGLQYEGPEGYYFAVQFTY
jgi:hypothetical protein